MGRKGARDREKHTITDRDGFRGQMTRAPRCRERWVRLQRGPARERLKQEGHTDEPTDTMIGSDTERDALSQAPAEILRWRESRDRQKHTRGETQKEMETKRCDTGPEHETDLFTDAAEAARTHAEAEEQRPGKRRTPIWVPRGRQKQTGQEPQRHAW